MTVIKRLVADLDIPVGIIGVPTVREDDGLALSSRNAYLTEDERAIAPSLHRELIAVAIDIANGSDIKERCARAVDDLLGAGFTAVDYVEAREAITLSPLAGHGPEARILASAQIGAARLIDNVPVP